MTRIDFHFNTPHRLQYAYRVVRKAYAANQPVVVYCSQTERLHQFDQLLWTFAPLDFLPHCHAHDALADSTPILLTATSTTLPIHTILVNLDDNRPPFFSEFERLIEIVSTTEEDRQHGRERYKFYKDRGYPLQHFEYQSKQ